jgi:hypothetical protein
MVVVGRGLEVGGGMVLAFGICVVGVLCGAQRQRSQPEHEQCQTSRQSSKNMDKVQ